MRHRLGPPHADSPCRILNPIRKSLAVGIGFRNEVTPVQIETAVLTALGNRTLDEVRTIATLDTKADNPALATFCERHRIPLVAFPASAIEACFDAHPALHRSHAARQHVGVDGVCEPCALLAASGGNLLAGKYAGDGVTVAIAPMAESHCAPHE